MNNEEILHLNPTLGIGDIITLKDITVSGDYAPRYQININLGWIAQYRDKEFADFIVELFKRLFNDDKYVLDFRDYALNTPLGVRGENYRMDFPDLSEFLCDQDFDVNDFKSEHSMDSYAVLSTRVRGAVIDAPLIRPLIARLLSKYDKLVLIGENGKFPSWQMRPTGTDHCIYNLCMALLECEYTDLADHTGSGPWRFNPGDKDRIVDLTSNKLDLSYFFYENSVNRHANMSVAIGYGGNLIRQLYTNPHNLFALINTGIAMNHPYISHALEAKKGRIFAGPNPCPNLNVAFLSSIEEF